LDNNKSFESLLYTVNASSFKDIALRVFQFQAKNNTVYRSFLKYLDIAVEEVRSIEDIPFMPISFFKTHEIKTGQWTPNHLFESSGTTGSITSRHYVFDEGFYKRHCQRCFEFFYGNLTDYHFLALLPSYLERKNSSLISMMDHFITGSQSGSSGFYLYDHERLIRDIARLQQEGNRKIVLWGVSFALLDFAEQYSVDLSQCMLFETGGMKGRRKELTRNELHAILSAKLNVQRVHSEYGMTELFSQAYSTGNIFSPSPWMRVIIREIGDPLNRGLVDQIGGINVVDLANFSTISFIETEDCGKVNSKDEFEVLGRLDNSDARGCNLLVE
jgi:hypothetical protein